MALCLCELKYSNSVHIRARRQIKTFSSYWPFVRGIHRWTVNSPHKGQWRGASMFSLICAWTNGWVNNRVAGDLGRHRAHYDVTVMTNNKTQRKSPKTLAWPGCVMSQTMKQMYSTSQEICTRLLLCCALLWLCTDWFTHIHQAYFTGTVAI